MKPIFARLAIPAFDLCWLTLDDGSSYVLFPGGGGSTKSGVNNRIQIGKMDEKGNLQFVGAFNTDAEDGTTNLCSSISSGSLHDKATVCAGFKKSCTLLQPCKSDFDDLSFVKLVEFQADNGNEDSCVNCSCFVKHENWIVTGGDDCVCRIWSVAVDNGAWKVTKIQEMDDHRGPVMAINAHPAERMFCSGGKDGFCKVWCFDKKELVANIPGVDVLSAVGSTTSGGKQSTECRGCCFSVDGFSLLFMQSARRGATSLVRWKLKPSLTSKKTTKKTGQASYAPKIGFAMEPLPSSVVTAAPVPCTRLVLSPTGEYCGIGASNGTINVFQSENLKKASSFSCHELPVTGLSFCPEAALTKIELGDCSDIIISCSADYTACTIKVGASDIPFKWIIALLVFLFIIAMAGLTYLIYFDQHAEVLVSKYFHLREN